MINVPTVEGLLPLAKMEYQGLDPPTCLKQPSHPLPKTTPNHKYKT